MWFLMELTLKKQHLPTHRLQGHKCEGELEKKWFATDWALVVRQVILHYEIQSCSQCDEFLRFGPSWAVSLPRCRAAFPTLQGQTQAPTKSPQCSKILYLQKNPLPANDEDVTLRVGKDLWSFYAESFETITLPSRFTLDFLRWRSHVN